jgi:hypothetical protein
MGRTTLSNGDAPAMSMAELQALPVSVDIVTAGRAFGLGQEKSYELAKQGEFPCPVLRVGRRYRVTRHHLFEALGEPESATAAVSEEATAPQVQRSTGGLATGCAAGDMAYLVVPVPAHRVLDIVRESPREPRPVAEH